MDEQNKIFVKEIIIVLFLVIIVILFAIVNVKIGKKRCSDLNLDVIEKNIKNDPEKQMDFYKSIRKKDINKIMEIQNDNRNRKN